MHASLLGVFFDFQGLQFFQTNKDVEIGTYVVCPTAHGTYIGKVEKKREATEEELSKEDFFALFPPILRVATFQDIHFLTSSLERERNITLESQRQADSLNLEMKFLNAHLDIDSSKVIITFTADGRVDFRELVKILNGLFHLKIELRQIGPRDQARLIGGIGACGLPLCCTTFLKTFDGISIAMAKNQLLAINIPKLSGACGKLMCCLKYEDSYYTELRPTFPKIGDKITYKNTEYSVTGINVLNDTITIYDGSNYDNVNREEYEKMKKGLEREKRDTFYADINAGVDLSGKGIKDTNDRINRIKINEERRKVEFDNRNKREEKNKNNRNNFQNRKNNSNKNNFQNRRDNHKEVKKESGFIPVSQIADKEILNLKPTRRKDEEN